MALAAGAGAAANGTASAVTGAFSRVDGNGINGFNSGFQGATSSVYGTFNVVGAKSGVDFDGVANSIIGVANKTENANASLIFGAGNKVTNSYRPVNGFAAGTLSNALQKAINTGDTDDMINALGDLVKDSGGSVLAIGGANIADYAQLSKLVGVGNKLTGTDGHESKYNMIEGYLNIGKILTTYPSSVLKIRWKIRMTPLCWAISANFPVQAAVSFLVPEIIQSRQTCRMLFP